MELGSENKFNNVNLKDKELMPTIETDRKITTTAFFMICVGMYVQLVSFMTGAQLYPALSPKTIIITAIIGNMFVWVLLVLTGDIGMKYGIPYAVYIRAPFGYMGAHIPGIARALPAVFWFGFQTFLGAQAIDEIIKIIFGASNLTVIIIVFGAIQIWNTALGINAIAKFDWVATPILIVCGVYIEYYLIKNYNITWEVFNAPGEGGISIIAALAIMAGPQITMPVNICDMTRYLKKGSSDKFFELNKGSMISQFWGLIPAMAMFVIIGMTSGIATGEYNPIKVMTQVFAGNPIMLILVLASFVIFAQVASNTGQNLLPPGNVIVNFFPGKIKFSTAVIIAGVIGLLIRPWLFEDKVPTILLGISCLLGPILGIMISDYYLLRKRKLVIEDLYDSNGQYRYMNNYNPAAFIVFIPGILSALIIPDYAMYISMFVGGLCYYLLMKFWIIKKYPQKEIVK
ncbi:MAG: cytosine permease [Sedimentibacter sp.]